MKQRDPQPKAGQPPATGEKAKQPYVRPELSKLGGISNLTAGGGQNKNVDTGMNSN